MPYLNREIKMNFVKPEREIDRVFLHCSASDKEEHDDVSVMRRWHTDPKPQGRGWSDVGYHFFIRKNGDIQEGRPLSRTPAAQGGHNTGTIAICLHGLEREKFTKQQYQSVLKLSREIDRAHDGMVTFHGHCEVSSKSCPVFSYREVLGLDESGAISGPGTIASDEATMHTLSPTLRLTDQGEAVIVLQTLLNRHDSSLVEDGAFGRSTLDAVLAFQDKLRHRRPGHLESTAPAGTDSESMITT
jgi:N-acetyl-anhydromuramyl-L-alanine amidase AmpD